MWFEYERLNGYERMRREHPRVSTPEYLPRRFYGDITHQRYGNDRGAVRLIQNNDYEEMKRIYFVEITHKEGDALRLRTESRKEAGELYDKYKLELMENE